MDEKKFRKKREIIAVGVFKLFSISCFYFKLLYLGVTFVRTKQNRLTDGRNIWHWSVTAWGYFKQAVQGRIQDFFFMRGCTRLLLYFNTNKPHSFFFCRILVVLENHRLSRGGGNAPPAPSPSIRRCSRLSRVSERKRNGIPGLAFSYPHLSTTSGWMAGHLRIIMSYTGGLFKHERPTKAQQ